MRSRFIKVSSRNREQIFLNTPFIRLHFSKKKSYMPSMQFTWAKRSRGGTSRAEWVGLSNNHVAWVIWQHQTIAKGKRTTAFRLIRATTLKIVGDFPALAAAKAKAEKLGE